MRPSDQKLLNRTYYYIDFKMFVDVLKYKMYKMKKSIEDQMKNVSCHGKDIIYDV
jgi:transcription initiation factor TFIIE subunit alpha